MNEINEILEYAKARKIAEKELKAERWVVISIILKKNGKRIRLHRYDIPISMLEKYDWVIQWRRAKYICQFPRDFINTEYYYYYKVNNIAVKEYDECIKSLIALKAKITLQENNIKNYLEAHKNELFFDPENDEQLIRIKKRLEIAKIKVQNTQIKLNDIVQKKNVILQNFN